MNPQPSIDAAEVRGLRLGLRRVGRLRIPLAWQPAWRSFAEREGLALRISEADVSDGEGGVGLHVAPRAGLRLALVALAGLQGEAAIAAALALELDDLRPRRVDSLDAAALDGIAERHRQLGALYGYPACCVEAFIDAHRETLTFVAPRVGDNYVAIARAAARSLRFDARLDTLDGSALQAQASPLRHLPCRFDCAASLELASALGGPLPAPRAVLVTPDGVVRTLSPTDGLASEASPTDASWWGRGALRLQFQ